MEKLEIQNTWYDRTTGAKVINFIKNSRIPENCQETPPDIAPEPAPNDIPLWDVDNMVEESPTLAKYFLKSQGIE
ncbi:hypothetical protein [Desulfoluna butyratoxydans]|uniref:Uncharacterized protein n=1 Tax=Desulfoluna butyratoxydans TaxID=231438 RepID=A0A4U8YP30_9BACT|nr:hypothetical protein [Desulfoluna butyratoxydans]VFQ45945.1 hypothetical protein MSL71_36080 [Desulfoluna butyratoxydans]